ncbi:hypothetical protein SESBI_49343 [Sesbania bispinosa]|nr:hypothetical protein SESBI_49343 [Sesbania bispinosa]
MSDNGNASSAPDYDWVLPEVLEKATEYISSESVQSFREDVIEAEGDPTALTRLLGQKRDKSTSTSQNSQAAGAQGSGTPTSTMAPVPPSPKRLRIEASSENISNPSAQTQTIPEVNRPPSVERPAEKWWLYFREFESAKDAEVISIFDRRFPMVDVIEGNLCKAADQARIQRAGLRNTTSIAQSMAARTSFLVHGLGHGIEVLEKENFELKQKLRVLNNLEAFIKELTQKVSSLEVVASWIPMLEKDIETQASKVRELETTNQRLSEEKTEMSSTISALQEEKTKLSNDFEQASAAWQSEEKELRTDMTLYHGNGFEKAISQVQFLYPDLDLSQIFLGDAYLLWASQPTPARENLFNQVQDLEGDAGSLSRLETIIWTSPRLGSQVRDLEGDVDFPVPAREDVSQVRDLEGDADSLSRLEKIIHVRDLEGDADFPEPAGENVSQVRDLEGDADSLSRLEKIIWPSPRLGRRCRLPESVGENNVSQVRDLEGDADSLSQLEKIIWPSPRLGRRCRLPESAGENNVSQVRDLEGDADSLSRLEKIIWSSPRLGRRCQLPEPVGENYLAKSETWKAMPTSLSRLEKIISDFEKCQWASLKTLIKREKIALYSLLPDHQRKYK